MVVVIARRVPMLRGASLRSRVKGNFQARFWNSGGQGDLPTDCGGMWNYPQDSCTRPENLARTAGSTDDRGRCHTAIAAHTQHVEAESPSCDARGVRGD